MNSLRLFSALLLSLGIAAGSVSAAPMYKWVDADGNVQYTQSPPPAGQEAQTIKPPPPPPLTTEEAQQRLQNYQESLSPPDPDKAKNDAEEQAAVREEQRNCDAAKRNLERYSDSANRRFRKPDGSVQIPTDQEREAEIAKAKQQIKVFCK